MTEVLKRGVTRARYSPRRDRAVEAGTMGILVPGFLVPTHVSCAGPLAQALADRSGADTYIMNDNGRGNSIKDRARRIADVITNGSYTKDADTAYIYGQSRGCTIATSLETELIERGVTVRGLGYFTPRHVDFMSIPSLAGATAVDIITTAAGAIRHPVKKRHEFAPIALYLANSATGLVAKGLMGELPTEIRECSKPNPDNAQVTSPVVMVFASRDTLSNPRRVFPDGNGGYLQSWTDVRDEMKSHFPQSPFVSVNVALGERHDLPLVRPRQVAQVVFDELEYYHALQTAN